MNPTHRRRALGLVGAALLGLLLVAPAVAQVSEGTRIEVIPGPLTGTMVVTDAFAAKSLTGLRQTTTGSLSFTVTDARGTGAGYNVTAKATMFAAANGAVLGDGLLSIGELTAVAQDGEHASASPAPVNAAGRAVLDATALTAVTLLTAGPEAGMGVYTVTDAPLTLVIPADAEVGTYTSIITIDTAAL